jgi:SWI/SNF-related matrix-associated actin-dependent regulator of chromatin subfamily A protein 2/4
VCNHPSLSYPHEGHELGANIVRRCGKLMVLDRLLLKLKATGHKVLLFRCVQEEWGS